MYIQGAQPSMAMPSQTANSMTDTQKNGLEEILSNYDAENLSDNDAASLVQEIKGLGIAPGRSLGQVLENAGIDARGLAEKAGISSLGGPGGPGASGGPGGPGASGGPGGPGGKGGPPPANGGGGPGATGGAKGADDAAVQTLQSIVEQLQESQSDSSSEDDFRTLLLQKLEEAGVDTSSPIVDYRV